MGIIPTIESTIDEFKRSTNARIEIDGGKTVIGGNGPLLTAAHFLEKLQAEIAALKEQSTQLEKLSVTGILIAMVPGDGSGHEVYAKSVEDVEDLLARLSEKAEDFDLFTTPLRQQVSTLQSKADALVGALQRASATFDKIEGAHSTDRLICIDAARDILTALTAYEDK